MPQNLYDSYMRSDAWKAKRLLVLERDRWQCMTCDCIHEGRFTKADLQVHHRHYRNLGNEPLEDLVSICPECHDAITAVHRRRRFGVAELPPNSFVDVVLQKVLSYGPEITDLPDQGCLPDHSAQWQNGKPARPLGQEVEGGFE